jgi:hypothetical protein
MSLPKSPVFLAVLLWCSIALQAQSCFVPDKSFSGKPWMYEGAFEDEACRLKSILDDDGIAGFSIVLRDYYPLKAYVEPYSYYDQVHAAAMAEVSQAHSSFLLIAKDHLESKALRYRVELVLPEAAYFANLSPFQRADIKQRVEDAIGSEAASSGLSFHLSSTATLEAAAVQKLIAIVLELKGGGYGSGAMMANAGFEAVPVEGQVQMTASAHLRDENSFDYAGITVSGGSGLGSTTLRAMMASAAPDPDLPVQLQQICIITHGGNNLGELNRADSVFRHNPAHIVLWLHLVKAEGSAADTIFIKATNNLSAAEAESLVNYYVEASLNEWLPTDEEGPAARPGDEGRSAGGCGTFGAEYGKRCWLSDSSSFGEGVAIGLFDGLMGTLAFLYEAGKKATEVGSGFFQSSLSYARDVWAHYQKNQSLRAVGEKVWQDGTDLLKEKWDSLVNTYNSIKQIALAVGQWSTIIHAIWGGITDWMGTLLSGDGASGYIVGTLCFEVISFAFSGGTGLGAKFLPKLMKVLDAFPNGGRTAVLGLLSDAENVSGIPGLKGKISKCKILGTGCFIAGTPVLVAAKSHSGQGKAIAFAAALPLVALPIEEVRLFDYALAHKTVNASYSLTASASGDAPASISWRDDPYTSDQQRARDRYALDDEHWHEVVFEEVRGSSTAKLALHRDWINDKGYAAGAVVEMHLPEQGISGPFRITSIKHILPQKRPEEENEPGDFAFQPVTGIFAHRSNDVWRLAFDSGDTLGVTYNHPIYSATAGDWRLAGELEVGEEVLTYTGAATLCSKTLLPGAHTVYNLEVKDWHNFLVGELGVVVHNNYNVLQSIIDGAFNVTKQFHKRYKCKEYATVLRQHLIQNGVENPKAVVYRLYNDNGQRVQMRIYHNGQEIATNGLHVGTPINGKMYDNMNPNGMNLDEWLSKFEYPPHLNLKSEVIDASKNINSFY